MTIKSIFSGLIFLSVIFINSAYSQKYSAIDSIVLKYPNFGNTEMLAERIKKDFTSDYDKARAVYSWVALNINYDVKKISKSSSSKNILF